MSWQDLKDMFREYGEVLRADIILDRMGRSKGFGTVLFRNPDDAQKAIGKCSCSLHSTLGLSASCLV